MKTGVRIKSIKGKKKWRKGDACVTNPTAKKHRETAKQTQIYQRKKNSALTAAALEEHDENFDDEDDTMPMSEYSANAKSGVSKSSRAFSISGLTDCTNMTFNKVTRMWSSQSDSSKQICAVLAAVTEVIRSRGGVESETEYFATLMTALETADDKPTKDAITFLLSLVLKKLPSTLLKVKFGETSKAFVTLLGDESQESGTAHIRNILDCFSTLLSAQEAVVWQDSSTMRIYHAILSFAAHSKPKIRKACHFAIKQILKLGFANDELHPAGPTTAKFCVHELESYVNDRVATLHILNLLKIVFQYFGPKEIKTVCEAILKIMSLGNVMTKVNGFQVLHCLFDAHPPDSNLPATLNGKIISALYEMQPSMNDVQVAGAWLTVMSSGHKNLARLDKAICSATFPKLFSVVMVYLLSDFKDVSFAAVGCLKDLVTNCMLPMSDYLKKEEKQEGNKSVFNKVFSQVEAGLKYKYQHVWKLVCQLLAVFYKEFGSDFHHAMMKSVTTLCDIHQVPKLRCKNDLEIAVGMAISTMGPKKLIEAYPLHLITPSGQCDFPRAWLLPVMKDHIQNTELQHFIDVFLPCAAKLRQQAHDCRQKDMLLEAKVYDTLQHQVWALLPGYCSNPSDLATSFKQIARFLGTALNEREDLCLLVLHALRTLINKNSDNDENREELAKFSKNYLPILFNLLTIQSSDKANVETYLSVLEAIKSYLTITDKKLVGNLLEKVLQKLVAEAAEASGRSSLLDLVVIMVPYATTEVAKKVFDMAVPLTKSGDVTTQKKSYRMLEEICSSRHEGCIAFLTEYFTDVQQCLLDSLSSAVAASKAPRLRCLTSIVGKLTTEQRDFVTTILPEVILCTKEINTKARSAAFNLLVEIGRAYIYLSGLPKEECVAAFFELVMAGLAGSSHMISATLLAFTKMVFEYRDCLSPRLVQTLLKAVIELLCSKFKEVRKASMIFVKALVITLDVDDLRQHSRELLVNLLRTKDGKSDNKHQARVVVERLTRKLGYETVRDLVPEQHRRFVVNLHKMNERNKRKRESGEQQDGGKRESSFDDLLQESESEDDEDTTKDKKGGRKTLKKKSNDSSKSWIMESQDDAVDFLDPKTSMKIVGTQPKNKPSTKKNRSDFKKSDDGRLLIDDDEDDTSKSADLQDFEMTSAGVKRKMSSSNDDESMDTGSTSGYRPGGRGIHRPLDEAVGGAPPAGAEYRSKKARGDVRVKGKPDPFTYIPLDRQKLNRRKKAKLAGQFHGVVKATKRASLKAKAKHARRR